MLADPLPVRGHVLRNRLVMTAITTNLGAPDGGVTEDALGFYRQRAGDVGLIVGEATAVRPDGRLVTGSLGAWEDAHVAGLARLAAVAKGRGAAAVLQLSHGGARAIPAGGELAGASPSGVRLRADVTPRPLGEDELRRLADDFAAAAGRVIRAGFDGVEIHGAHLYLVSQFLSPLANHRADRYGGDAIGRATFAREVVEAVRARIGPEPLLLFRLNGVERIEGGQTPEDAARAAGVLARAGVDVLDVSLGARLAWRELEGGGRLLESSSILAKEEARGAALPAAAALRQATGIPVIAVGKLAEVEVAEAALRSGATDLIGIGRQLIADPEAAGKLLRDGGLGIDPCTECVACMASIRKGPLKCAANPDVTGRGAAGTSPASPRPAAQ